jgi:hypothetical protein
VLQQFPTSTVFARHGSVVVAVSPAVHCSANYKKNIIFKMKFKNVNKLFTLIIYYKLVKVTSYET